MNANAKKYIPSRKVLVGICALSFVALCVLNKVYAEHSVSTRQCTAVGWTEDAQLTLEISCDGEKHTTANGVALKRFVGGETALTCDVKGDGKISCNK